MIDLRNLLLNTVIVLFFALFLTWVSQSHVENILGKSVPFSSLWVLWIVGISAFNTPYTN